MSYVGSYTWSLRNSVGHDLLVMPAAQVLLLDERDRVFLQKRTDLDGWEIPSGACEPDTSFAATACREVFEEAGLEVEPDSLAAFACLSDPAVQKITYPNGDRTHYFSVCFFSREWSGTVRPEPEEVSEAGFFGLDDLPAPLIRSTEVALDLFRRFRESHTFQVG